MDESKKKFTELPEEEYNEQLNSLNSDINNLVSSLNNLLDKEKELLKMEAEKVKAKKIITSEQLENEHLNENVEKQKKKTKIYSFLNSLWNKIKNTFGKIKFKKKKMKNFLILTIVAICLASCNSSNQSVESKSNSKAETMNGIYIFIKSKPTTNYDFLGSIELKWYDKFSELDQQNLQSAIKNLAGIISFSDNLENTLTQVKQKYPTADGVIFDDEMSRCEVIKFK